MTKDEMIDSKTYYYNYDRGVILRKNKNEGFFSLELNSSKFTTNSRWALDRGNIKEATKEQSIEEILEICKKKYPIGTKVKCLDDWPSSNLTSGIPYIIRTGNKIVVNTDSYILTVYKDGKYADIIKEEVNHIFDSWCKSTLNHTIKNDGIHPTTESWKKFSDIYNSLEKSTENNLEFQSPIIIKSNKKKSKFIFINQ